jgi:hypothetical protein
MWIAIGVIAWIAWTIINGFIASEKRLSVAAAVVASFLACPVLVWAYLVGAVPRPDMNAAGESAGDRLRRGALLRDRSRDAPTPTRPSVMWTCHCGILNAADAAVCDECGHYRGRTGEDRP